jgi:hypothetical protein
VAFLVDKGVERSGEYGLADPSGVSLFVTLMFLLGSHFDRDPFLAWTGEILTDEASGDENVRIQRLYRSSVEYLDRWLEKM